MADGEQGNAGKGGWVGRALTSGVERWQRVAGAQVARISAGQARADGLAARQLAWAKTAIDESATLAKASIDYSVQLGVVWRTLTIDAMKAAVGVGAGATPPAR